MYGPSGTALRVRDILGTRGLTLHRASQRSAQAFGRNSLFYVPHNLYHTLAKPSFRPTIHQILAFSHVTDYLLPDWLSVFGFDLDRIFRLQLLIPRQRTTVLDSTTYDRYAWVPWFAERLGPVPAGPITPLGQFLQWGCPRRAVELLARSENRFVYAKIGEEDVHARPYFDAGQIVRADASQAGALSLDDQSGPEGRFFLIEHDAGWTCSRLVLLGGDRILLHCPQQPCAERELYLGRGGRILGAVDAEVRRTPSGPGPSSAPTWLNRRRPRPTGGAPPSLLRNLLRQARIRSGMSFREASAASRIMAETLSDPLYFIAAGTLSDYEAADAPPGQIHKMLTICLLYSIPLYSFLRTSGLPVHQAGHQPIPDAFVPWRTPRLECNLRRRNPEVAHPAGDCLSALVHEWEEVPLFLRWSLQELTGMKNLSLSDLFWVRGDRTSADPPLSSNALIAVNRRARRPASVGREPLCGRRLYIVLKRDGEYDCGRYSFDNGKLTLHARPTETPESQHPADGIDAEIVGQVTAVIRRFV